MSIKLYTGLQGSGKSYEVVSVVILGALRDGRRVISNIAGLNYEVMRRILIEEGTEPANIGTLVQVSHADIEKVNFFRMDTDDQTGTETFIQGGDLVTLDEIWRFWEKDSQVTARQQNFFRMHRHMLHPDSGMSCEIVLISQDVMDVCRKIRSVVEKTYVMTKHTEMGTDKHYRVDIYSRAKFTMGRTEPLNSLQKSYNPKYFECYKSHSAGGDVVDPKEVSVDKRGSIWSKPIFKYGIPLALLPLIPSAYFLWHFFHPKPVDVQAAQTATTQSQSVSGVPVPHDRVQPEINQSWRIVGFYTKNSSTVFMITDAGGQFRQLVNPPNYQFLGQGASVELPEGGFATSWTQINKQKGPI